MKHWRRTGRPSPGRLTSKTKDAGPYVNLGALLSSTGHPEEARSSAATGHSNRTLRS